MDQLEFQFGSGHSGQTALVDFLDSQKELLHSVRVEYPSVFALDHGAQSLWVEVQGKVVSHAAFVERTFKHPLFQFSLGLIGSVATAPEFQGRGLATSLVSQALERLRAKRCLAAMLWSSKESFYTPMGFSPAGVEQELWFERPFNWATDGVVKEGIAEDEVPLLWHLYQSQDVLLDRPVDRFSALLKVPFVRCLTLRRNGTIAAYAILNKGSDFTDVIHEWVGAPDDICTLVAVLKSKDYENRPLRLIAPGHRILGALLTKATRVSSGNLGLLKVLDRPALRSIYLSHLRNQSVKAEWGDELKVAGRSYKVDSEEQFVRTIWGVGGAGFDAHPTPKLPFFIWGLDSI
jgi:GNAT superfamily N-acetyltransferase